MKREFKQWWSTIPPISRKRTITSDLYSLNRRETATCDVGNPRPGLGQTQKCGRIKPVDTIPTSSTLFPLPYHE